MTNATSLDFNSHPSSLRLRNFPLDYLKWSFRVRDLYRTHFFRHNFSIDLFFRKDKGAPPFRMEERAPPRPTCALLPRTNKFSEAEFQ